MLKVIQQKLKTIIILNEEILSAFSLKSGINKGIQLYCYHLVYNNGSSRQSYHGRKLEIQGWEENRENYHCVKIMFSFALKNR